MKVTQQKGNENRRVNGVNGGYAQRIRDVIKYTGTLCALIVPSDYSAVKRMLLVFSIIFESVSASNRKVANSLSATLLQNYIIASVFIAPFASRGSLLLFQLISAPFQPFARWVHESK